ncbi:polyprenyl synthetase family protein [Metabacillus halosaccharovorans]|uniref:Polyprenyl synthetase family protein n=1 Tax=Metabacillus halosaccharovorans TaxID=930124 RepID=A0ABT3DGX8_9BACI|nr:polyprenyl synthetase family protein [Metabacillus halosaccharovorans]MCV9886179.1 polyprenyl synthetase family protein [Metabacillus halosaccharovorans]
MFTMNKVFTKNADEGYLLAEKQASHYFSSLYKQLSQKTYVTTLTNDFASWKQHHLGSNRLLSFFSRWEKKDDSQNYNKYIQWMEKKGKLDHYLERSVSYIYMRDLGKTLYEPETKSRIQHVVQSLKTQLTQTSDSLEEKFDMSSLYRWAKKEGIESTFIWLIHKLKTVSLHIPNGMDATHAQRKLIKIIAGVVMHAIEEMEEDLLPTERSRQLNEAIRLGYAYGLTYPFIDDLLDSKVLSEYEKRAYSELIRTTLVTGSVPDLGEWKGGNKELMTFIHSELKQAFDYIKVYQSPEKMSSFLEQSYVFFHSQEEDRMKDLENEKYTNEELFIPVILKSASSRLIVRSVLNTPEDEEFESRTFYYGIYNQLADDFADMFDDMNAGAVTPYTYYLTYHNKRDDLINPFELYWTVISHLIHNIYHSDPMTCEVMLDRAINGLKRFKQRIGTKKYHEVMKVFTSDITEFNHMIQQLVQKATDVDFFDKLLRDHIITTINNNREEQDKFIKTVREVRNRINPILQLPYETSTSIEENSIVEAANYSLEGDGKRLRPIMSWVIGVDVYGLDMTAIQPLLKSLEYMHTASLIFDDLPAQDNAPIRRGRPTLHEMYTTATAELTGLFLTQKAVKEQASLDMFYPKTVLNLIQYSAQMTADMCKGQAMDLESKGKKLTLEQLNEMCFYKTGLAFEACLIMPAILAHADEKEMEDLKTFAYHAGIAFQIKDDLLDFEGESNQLGKLAGIDAENDSSTFVSVLGVEKAKKEMWEHYCLAMDALQEMPRHIPFLKHLLSYFVNRDR